MARNRHTPLPRPIRPIDRLLLIEDNYPEARLLQEILKGSVLHHTQVIPVQRLAESIAYLQEHTVDVILLDLTLPDSDGLASLDMLLSEAPGVPIVVMTHTNDDDLAVEAVRRGAQDYLVKRQVNQDVLVRSLRYAIERQQSEEALREANETLEQRVRQRTAELESANAQLLTEIQERHHIQERLTLAQQAAKMGTFEWDLGTDTIIWSLELAALYGANLDSFNNSPAAWLATIHPDDRPALDQALEQARQTLTPLDIEFRILRDRHDIRWIAVKSNRFCDPCGNAHRMVGIHMDITEKKQLEGQFLRAQRMESLGTLASGIAHDLNNILTPILGVAQLLPLKFPDMNDQTRHLLEILETSARRGSTLIKQILSFARGIEGKRISLKLSHILREVRQLMEQTLPKSIEFILDIEPDLWTVMGDVTQLHQVFVNLCVNARDAMPHGGTLTISAHNIVFDDTTAHAYLDAQPGPYIQVQVQDTGKGIPPDILPRIFDPFFTTKAVGKGTGLGLSAVLGILKSHGGFLDVSSEVDRGTQFTLFLPATPIALPDLDPAPSPLLGNAETILIVDDEVAICEVLKTTLETYRYQVLTASSGEAAIAHYQANPTAIDLMIIDLMMPGLDGIALLATLQHLHPTINAIAMSGLNSSAWRDRATATGFCTFLAKPITTPDLLQAIRHCLPPLPVAQ